MLCCIHFKRKSEHPQLSAQKSFKRSGAPSPSEHPQQNSVSNSKSSIDIPRKEVMEPDEPQFQALDELTDVPSSGLV